MNNSCVFCKIIKGKLDSHKIYEDKFVMAISDANPVTKGHTLIITKKHFENLFDIPVEDFIRVSKVAKKLAVSIKKELNSTGVNLMNASGKDAQQSVFHFHLHLVPRYKNDGLDLWLKKSK